MTNPSVQPKRADPTRLALHYASQIPAAFAAARVPAVDDFSHTTLTWENGGLWSARSAVGRRVGLVFDTFSIIVDTGGAPVRIALKGLTLYEALAQTADACGLEALLQLSHDLPASPLGLGGAFRAPPPVLRGVWASWFAHAFTQLEPVAARPDATPIRVWPHHFDTASLIQIDPPGREDARSVGVGFSPGDSDYPDGYWYVNLWPAPDAAVELPALTLGNWHTEGWTGAVLTVREMGAAADARAEAFLRGTVATALRLINPRIDAD